ncbi:MAG TPA: hypothetical protein PKX48_01740 [Planctomycetota bacterium]|nr:hypothetical protein [Planctomycetota bacterium]OQC21637.1 MAG: hypothetical protein BWX69_00851 [Planctomycetes bacterium ADurb.Bin069]NMD35720.1 hypothetical protein [Planctomycetota bacterium]HNU26191.1 hypothetical protein [Planctomycetota bacterium]HOE28721.1 hypothetical protein [Planctomycetota bacterium]
MHLIALCALFAAQDGAPLAFTRFAYEDFDRGGLYTATVTCRRGATEVELVSVVHIADEAYYREIQRELASCDLVFFELVAGAGGESTGALSALQQAAGQALHLVFQLEALDYHTPGFVHSDLSWDEIRGLLGGKPLSQPPQAKLLERFLPRPKPEQLPQNDFFADNPEMRRALKVFLGQLLGDIPATLALLNLENPDERTDILISARNRRAMDILAPHLDRPGRLALLWGAAHMPDFARRLARLGFEPAGARWHLAWKIGPIREQRWF